MPATAALNAAKGATVYSDPMVRQAVQRVREGRLSPGDFKSLYGGQVQLGLQKAQDRHAGTHGLRPLPAQRQLQTLVEK